MPSKANQEMLKKAEESLANSSGVFVIDYRGLTVKESQELRRGLRQVGASMRIYKNNIVRLAIQNQDLPAIDAILEGPCAYVFYEKDPVDAAKVVKDMSGKLKKLAFLGGISEGNAITANQALAIADLPSRDELLARLAAAVVAPLSGVARVLNAPLQSFATVLTRVGEAKEKPAEAASR